MIDSLLLPASHVTISPVMFAESSDARNATTPAMSAPDASFLSGQLRRRRAAFAGSRTSQRSVYMYPGAQQLTRIPSGAKSSASERTIELIAPFEAQ